MIGNHPVRYIMCAIRIRPGRFGRRHNQAAHQIDIIIIMLALQHRSDTFKTHARVNRGFWQGQPLCRGLFILHEHQIPDFDKPVAILVR